MIELTIEGIPNPVRVDESFRTMSEAERGSVVEEIKAAWSAQQGPRAAPAPSSSEPTGFGLGALREGARNAARGLGATARVLGDATGSETLRGVGQTLDEAVPADPNYRPSTPEVVEGIRNLEPGRVLRNLPGAIAETLPGMGVTAAAGAAGSAVGGPVGGFLAAGAAGGAQQFGQIAETRAQNDGRETPNATDLAAAGGTALVSGALDAVGARGLGGAATGAARGVVPRVGQAAGHAAREAGTEAAQDVVEQAGGTAGTDRGLTIDPAQAAAAGTIGGASRGAVSVPGAAVRGTVESAAMAGANRAVGDISPREAASIERVNRALEQRRVDTQAVSGRAVPLDELLNSTREEMQADVHTIMRQAQDAGWIDADEYRGLRSVFETAVRHNKELADGGVRPDGEDYRAGLARLDELRNAPPVFRNTLNDLFRDLNTLAAAARKKNVSGPFERLGDFAGRVATVGLGSAAGGLPGAIAGAAMSVAGNPVPARVGAFAGKQVDLLAGTRMPVVVMARQKALKTLQRSKAGDPGDSRALIAEVSRILTDERLAARAALGLKTDPDTMARLAAEKASQRLNIQMADADQAAQDIGARARARARLRVQDETIRDVQNEQDSIQAQVANTEAVEQIAARRRARTEDRVGLAAARDVAAEAARRVRAERRSTEVQEGAQTGSAPGAPAEPVAAPSEAPAGALPAPEPTVVPDRAGPSKRGPMFGWQRYVQRAVQSKGKTVTRDEMRAAVRQMGEQGDLLSDEVEAILTKDTDRLPPRLLGGIIAAVAERQGWSFEDTPDVQFTAPAPGQDGARDNPTIHSPTRYASATESYRRAVERASQRAHDAGDFELVELVETFGVRTLSELPMNVRKLRAEQLIAASPDAVTKARRRAALNPLLREQDDE